MTAANKYAFNTHQTALAMTLFLQFQLQIKTNSYDGVFGAITK